MFPLFRGLGRDYLKVGLLTEIQLPEKGVRFIAINDGVDSNQGVSEYIPFRNVINEWYAKDTSTKQQNNPEENQMVFENTHEPIIEQDVWDTSNSCARTSTDRLRQVKPICSVALPMC